MSTQIPHYRPTELADEAQTAALRFRRHQDAFDFARNFVERGGDLAAMKAGNIAERYLNQHLAIESEWRSPAAPCKYKLMLLSIPQGRDEWPYSSEGDHTVDGHSIDNGSNGFQKLMFAAGGHVVQSGEMVIPSLLLMSIEVPEQVSDIGVQVLTPAFDSIFEALTGFSYGEVRARRVPPSAPRR